MGNIPQAMIDAQELVVRRLLPKDFSFFQIQTALDHPTSVDVFIRATSYETILVLDIDCIPLSAAALGLMAAEARPDQLIGCAQRASHIDNGGHVYAGPFCCGVNRRLYVDVGAPSFAPTSRGDVGEELTFACEALGKGVKLWWPTAVEESRWKLTDQINFGIGTTYADRFWHLFEARSERNQARFVAKCFETLENSERLGRVGVGV
jgi:hypothetical protein